jgi:hypothetical protein
LLICILFYMVFPHMKGLYQRNSIWWIRFSHNGTQYRRSTETTDFQLAKKKYYKVNLEISEGEWLENPKPQNKTFAELAKKYEEQVLKEQKCHINASSYLKQLKEFFGRNNLTLITPALIDDFKNFRKKQGVKPATINRQLTILKRMLNLAKKRWMWMSEVPDIEMEQRADKKRLRHLSFAEFQQLLGSFEDRPAPGQLAQTQKGPGGLGCTDHKHKR